MSETQTDALRELLEWLRQKFAHKSVTWRQRADALQSALAELEQLRAEREKNTIHSRSQNPTQAERDHPNNE